MERVREKECRSTERRKYKKTKQKMENKGGTKGQRNNAGPTEVKREQTKWGIKKGTKRKRERNC